MYLSDLKMKIMSSIFHITSLMDLYSLLSYKHYGRCKYS